MSSAEEKKREIATRIPLSSLTNKRAVDLLAQFIIKHESASLDQLLTQISKRARQQQQLSQLHKSQQLNLDIILNKSTYGDLHRPLIVIAASENSVEMIEILLKYNANVNVTSKTNETALYFACWNNNVSMVKILLSSKNNANPNIIDTENNVSCIWRACYHGNLEIIRLLLNNSNSNSNSIKFDWDLLINKCDNKNGANIFHLCCQFGFVDCLKYLFEIEKHFNTKIDIFCKTNNNDNQMNGLLLACNNNQPQMIEYLLTTVYKTPSSSSSSSSSSGLTNDNIDKKQQEEKQEKQKPRKQKNKEKNKGKNKDKNQSNTKAKEKRFNINDCTEQGMTALWFCALYGNLDAIKLIFKHYGNSCDINKCDDSGASAFFVGM